VDLESLEEWLSTELERYRCCWWEADEELARCRWWCEDEEVAPADEDWWCGWWLVPCPWLWWL